MKIAAMTLMAAIVGAAAELGQPQQRLTVYLRYNALVPRGIETQALELANQMFGTIGIRMDWRIGEPPRTSSTRPIGIELVTDTPENLLPGTLAYALPFEGTHVVVFYDRVENRPGSVSSVLGHVIAHEVTHILQGVARHSKSGIMKAQWTGADYQEMTWKPLQFTDADVMLIHLGLKARGAPGSSQHSCER